MFYTFRHYYGDIVRYLFLAAAVIMIITLPIFNKQFNFPIIASVIAIAVLGVAAGLTNPKQFTSALINFLISLFGFIVFLYSGTTAYQTPNVDQKLILTDIILSSIFLFAVYFSMKTLRAQVIGNNPPPPTPEL